MSYTAVKGMHDILPPESARWQAVEAALRGICALYGFHEIRTPIVEKTPLFVRGIGQATTLAAKEMYSFADQGDESLTLRPEGTASVVRAYIEAGVAQTDSLAKYYYIGPMFRRERPQKGRYRQFHQFGAESLGSAHPAADVEIIALCLRIFSTLGLAQCRLELNSLGCAACRPKYFQLLEQQLQARQEQLCSECQQRLLKNPLRVFDCKNPQCQKILEDAPTIADHWCAACIDHFGQVRAGLDTLKIAYVLNPRIARGLDYYVRTAFEVIAEGLGAQNALGGGGRYDGLVQALGGPDVPGVGFAIGMERLMLVLGAPQASLSPGLIFVAAVGEPARQYVLPLMEQWRSKGTVVEWDVDGRSLKSQMRRADKLGAPTVVIIGDEELRTQRAIVRDMRTKEQKMVPFAELLTMVPDPTIRKL